MDTIRTFGRKIFGFENSRKRRLENEYSLGKEQLEDPVDDIRSKRPRLSQDLELSFSEQLVSPIKKVWSWFTNVNQDEAVQGRWSLGCSDTIQAAAPTRLHSHGHGQEMDEVQLVKVVNPRLDSNHHDTDALVEYELGPGFQAKRVSNHFYEQNVARPATNNSAKSPGYHIRTAYEKERQSAHLKTGAFQKRLKSGTSFKQRRFIFAGEVRSIYNTNWSYFAKKYEPTLFKTLVSGLTSAPNLGSHSTYEKIFNEQKKKQQQRATDYCMRLGEREVYRQLLETQWGVTSATGGAFSSSVRLPLSSRLTPLFTRPQPAHDEKSKTNVEQSAVKNEHIVTSTVIKTDKLSPEVKDDSISLDASPVLDKSRKSKSRATDVVDSLVSPRHEEEEVCSQEFISNLRKKYDAFARERERQIQREIQKKDFHRAQSEKATSLVEERLKNYLTITQVAYDSVVEKKLAPKELTPLTPEMEEVIAKAERAHGQVLIEAYNIPITGRDLKTLQGLNWLNDEVINFYLQMIVKRSQGKDFPSVFAFSTFFYPKLIDGGHSSVKRWSKKVDLFAQSMVLIPVHLGMHWCLAVIDIENKAVDYYDSMGGNNNKCLAALITYIADEHLAKKGTKLDTSKWTKTLMKSIPQQMNGSDCGMFACKFSEYLSRRVPITFTQKDMPYFRRRMIYEIVKNDLRYP